MPGLRIIKEQCSKDITDKHIEEIEREVTAKAKELVSERLPVVFEVVLVIQNLLEIIN